jgi:hypothetical protein
LTTFRKSWLRDQDNAGAAGTDRDGRLQVVIICLFSASFSGRINIIKAELFSDKGLYLDYSS